MNSIVLENINKAYGKNEVVKCLNLTINEGERLILLGPSGCGKTTILRMIAGLEEITGGKLHMGDRVVNDVAPGDRNVAMVFQNYALFPHMTVWENIIFGLRLQKLPEDEITRRATEAVEILNLKGYEQRLPKELSGGQKQRVALCRALVKRSPYFLLDEPLSNLDAQLRQQARTELVKLHRIYRPTMVYVTHDQIEAMTVAHRIAVMKDGYLQQLATPKEIYHNPANTFVARFIGTPPMNLLEASVIGDKILVGSCLLDIPKNLRDALGQRTEFLLGIRPEKMEVSDKPLLKAEVTFVEDLGNQKILKMEMNKLSEAFYVAINGTDSSENIVGVSFDWEEVCIFDKETGKNLLYKE